MLDLSQNLDPSLLRRSSRHHKQPTYLKDYVCSTATSHWCNLVNASTFPIHHQQHLTCPQQWIEPSTYKQASQDPSWVEAITKELQALAANNTWDIVPLSRNKKAIRCRWIYKVKLKTDGSLERFKACLVAKAYT